jgi:hypothetical protein
MRQEVQMRKVTWAENASQAGMSIGTIKMITATAKEAHIHQYQDKKVESGKRV